MKREALHLRQLEDSEGEFRLHNLQWTLSTEVRFSERRGDPMGVARILTFLASPDADYMRGTIFTR